MLKLGEILAERKANGRKLLVGYVTAGLRDDWQQVASALVAGGVDAIEVGIPFSDPVMDGPVIQQASSIALERGTTPASVLAELRGNSIAAPLAVMTYYNLVHRYGLDEFAKDCKSAGVSGAILPDLSLEESLPWRTSSVEAGIDNVFLVAPNTSEARLKVVCDAAGGFVYAVGTLGVTGERSVLADSAGVIGDRARAVTDKPVLIGVGVSTPEQAQQAVRHADGVIVGTAIVRAMLEGSSPARMEEIAQNYRTAIDN